MTLKRRDFIKKAGIGLISGPFILRGMTLLQAQTLAAAENLSPFNCILSPSQMGGPFYKDPKYDRKDITEGKFPTGLPFKLKVIVMGKNNCQPVRDCVVNIWHCNLNGGYSEFGAVQGNPEDGRGKTWLRGYQMTDSMGEAFFETIYPGWYDGRCTHIHFDCHIGFKPGGVYDTNPDASSTLVSQMYFNNQVNTKVYTGVNAYQKGDNPTKNESDMVYTGSGTRARDLHIKIDETDFPNSLSGEFTVGLDMDGIDPTSAEELQGMKYFELEQNYPNPFSQSTTIPFTLKSDGTVTITVFSVKGEIVGQLVQRRLPAGEYTVDFDKNKTGMNLPAGNYMFDMRFHNREGMFRQSKNMVIL